MNVFLSKNIIYEKTRKDKLARIIRNINSII